MSGGGGRGKLLEDPAPQQLHLWLGELVVQAWEGMEGCGHAGLP